MVHVAVSVLETDGLAALTARRLAARADASVPAVYELFGDKAGLVREVFFEGFTMLSEALEPLAETADQRGDLVDVLRAVRSFAREHPVITEVMFSRPFVEFDPGPAEAAAGRAVRELIVGRVRRCRQAGLIVGDDTDVAHVLLALVQGLSAQEVARWLGTTRASRDRRWDLAVGAVLDGLAPPTGDP
jgi:AcrR family transcriptional regulator